MGLFTGLPPAAVEFIREAITLFGIAVLCIALRTYARLHITGGFRHLKADDFLMILAGIVYGIETCLACMVGLKYHGLANNGMTLEQRKALTPDNPEFQLRVGGSKIQLMGWPTYTSLLWLLKCCMIIYYTRLANGYNGSTTRIRIGFGAIGVTYVIAILSILLGCGLPFSKNWQIYPEPTNHCQPAISKIDCYVVVVLNVATDLYLMSIPLPMLWRAQIPLKRKILLCGMFSGGMFVVMAGILRAALILHDPVGGAQKAGSWAVRETFVSVIIGNVPMIYPLFLRGYNKLKTYSSSRGTSFSLGGSKSGWSLQKPGSGSDGSGRYDDSSRRNKRRPMSIGMSMPTTTESGEHIVMDTGIKSETTFEVRSVPADEEMPMDTIGSSGRKPGNLGASYTISVDGKQAIAPRHGTHKGT